MKKLFTVVMLFVAAVVFADQYDKWLDEEVKPIITKSERDAFKKLKTPEEKDQFIKDFWAKRDPSAGTPENEYKNQYEERLKSVQEKMKGAKALDTDMGMTAMILGNPTEVKKEDAKSEDDVPAQTWTFKGMPKQMGLPDSFDIKFVGDAEAGGFKFADPKKAHEFLDKGRDFYAQLTQLSGGMQADEKAKMEAQQKAAEVTASSLPAITTPAVRTALDAVAAGNAPKDVVMEGIADAFMTSKSETFGTWAISSTGDMAAAKVGVRILDSAGTMVKEGEYAFADPLEAPGHYQGGTSLKAGDYSILLAVVNGDKSGGTKVALKVPDFAGFSMSSLILAKNFKQLEEAKLEKEPYTFGKIKVEPSVDRIFTKADEVIVVYEAYNFQMDAAAGKPNLSVVFTFQMEGDSPKSTPPSAPNGLVTGNKITIPTSYPLAKFPPGKYKLTVTLTDAGTSKTATQNASFVVK